MHRRSVQATAALAVLLPGLAACGGAAQDSPASSARATAPPASPTAGQAASDRVETTPAVTAPAVTSGPPALAQADVEQVLAGIDHRFAAARTASRTDPAAWRASDSGVSLDGLRWQTAVAAAQGLDAPRSDPRGDAVVYPVVLQGYPRDVLITEAVASPAEVTRLVVLHQESAGAPWTRAATSLVENPPDPVGARALTDAETERVVQVVNDLVARLRARQPVPSVKGADIGQLGGLRKLLSQGEPPLSVQLVPRFAAGPEDTVTGVGGPVAAAPAAGGVLVAVTLRVDAVLTAAGGAPTVAYWGDWASVYGTARAARRVIAYGITVALLVPPSGPAVELGSLQTPLPVPALDQRPARRRPR